MMWLLADIGGTHSRLTLADTTGLLTATSRHYDNENFADLPALLRSYLTETGTHPKAACIAMAGPVSACPPRLTNRDWIIDPDALAPLLGCRPLLLNDLEALALSLPFNPASRLLVASPDAPTNGQRLAVGIGTGMNVCPLQGPPTEYGHTPLPAPLQNALPSATTVEDLFSGRGLAAFRARGGNIRDYSALIGILCATLAAQYLPLDGIALAGGVARAVLKEEPEI
ncbi:MAG: glucokinase, partial [Rhodobacteraceae bacterium]|nr:glucokinase [Paracoccaceae bacterium]